MKITDYMTQNKLTDEAFARQIGVARATVTRYRNGTLRPGWDVVDRIKQVTKGAVLSADFEKEVEGEV